MPSKTIAIIGGGIVGLSTAIWLRRAGQRVIVIDKPGPETGRASFGNAGLLASSAILPVTEPGIVLKAAGMLLHPNKPLFLKWRYLPRLAPWLARHLSHATGAETRRIATAMTGLIGDSLGDHQALAEGTAATRYVIPCDYLHLYRDRGDFAHDALSWAVRRENGFTWDELEGDALHAAEPIFGPGFGFATRLGNHGRISDPGAYLDALAAHVQTEGGSLIRASAEAILHENGHVTGVRAGGEVIACDAVVIAAGAWSKPLAQQLGLTIPLETERGYHLELWGASQMPRHPVMVSSGKFVMTPMEGRLRLAGIVEFGGLKAPRSRAPFALLRRQLRATLPDLTWRHETEWMGHRPTTTDSLPLIGRVPGTSGAWLGFGHQHVGLTAGAKTGRLLSQMITGQRPNMDLTPFDPARFSRLR